MSVISENELENAAKALYKSGCAYRGWDNIGEQAKIGYRVKALKVLLAVNPKLLRNF